MFRLFAFSLSAGLVLASCNEPVTTPVPEEPATTTTTSSHPVSLTEITNGVWMHTTDYTFANGGKIPSNGLLVEDGADLILVDTAWGEKVTEDLIVKIEAETGKKVTKLIITHHHYDRLAGVDILEARGVEVFTHPETPIKSMALGTPTPDRAVTALTAPGSRVKVGAVEVAYPGPGHAHENLVVFVPEANVLFGGCMIRGGEFKTKGNVEDANLEAWPASLEWVRKTYKQTAVIVPGHGKQSNGLELIDHTAAILKQED